MTILHQQRQGSNQTAHWILLADKGILETGELWFDPTAFRKEPGTAVILSSSLSISEDSAQSSSTLPSPVPKDLLGLLAYLGLDLYVKESIKASFSPLSVSYANYLLSCVLLFGRRYGIMENSDVPTEKKLRLVGFLLNQGANPNEAAVGGTLWTLFLVRMYEQRSQRKKYYEVSLFPDAAWAAAAKAFLAAGANIHEQISILDEIGDREDDPCNFVSYFKKTEDEDQRGSGYLALRQLSGQLSVLSCLSCSLPKMPQLASIQEECIGKGARYLVEFSSIEYDIVHLQDSSLTQLQYTLSKEQSDRLVPAYEAYAVSEQEFLLKFSSENVALKEQLLALYHEFFEEEERRRFPKITEATRLND